MEIAAQYGIAGVTLAILFFCIRYFVNAMTVKDKYIKDLVADFQKTINNHIQHQTEATGTLSEAIKELSRELRKK